MLRMDQSSRDWDMKINQEEISFADHVSFGLCYHSADLRQKENNGIHGSWTNFLMSASIRTIGGG